MADPTPSPVTGFLSLLMQALSFKKRINQENFLEEFAARLAFFVGCTFLILGLVTITLLLKENSKSFKSGITHQSLTGYIFISLLIITFLLFVIWLLSTYRVIYNFKIENKDLLSTQKIVDSTIISRLNALESNINLKFSHSQRFFEKLIKEHVNASSTTSSTPYVKFVEDFTTSNKLAIDRLTSITEEAELSTNGCFYCVIAYDGFFSGDVQTEESIRYFASFYRTSSKNLIQRVFTMPGSGTEHTVYKTSFTSSNEKNKNSILLKYLIVNKISSIETYLMIYDQNNLNNIRDEFFALSDYVIALPSYKNGKEENILYFAYPEDPETKRDRVIKTNDSYLINLMQKDFRYRIQKVGSNNSALNIVELRRQSYYDILVMLGYDRYSKKDKIAINEQIDELKTVLYKMSSEHCYYDKKVIDNLLSNYYIK